MRNAPDSFCVCTISQPDCAADVSTHAVSQHIDSMTQPAAKRKNAISHAARAGPAARPKMQLLRRDPMRGRRARGVQWRSQSKELLISRPFVLRQISAMGERSHVAATRQHRRTLSRGALLAPHRRVRAAATWQPRAGRSHAAHVADGSDARGRREAGGGRRAAAYRSRPHETVHTCPSARVPAPWPRSARSPALAAARARAHTAATAATAGEEAMAGNKARRVHAEPQP